MKFLAMFLFLAGGCFITMVVLRQFADWGQSLADIAGTSLISGVLGTVLVQAYLRYIRKGKKNS
ncbi:hypothetical protein GCM10027431_20420 [Lysobacter rhizosphaerae]|jgi:hypothetical protein